MRNRLLTFFCLLVQGLILLLPHPVAAQQAVSLDLCSGCVGNNLVAGQLHTLRIRVNNSGAPTGVRYNINNGFKLYSPNNPQWQQLSLAAVSLGDFPPANFNTFAANCIGCDGESQDLIQFGGVALNCSRGLPPGFNDIAYQITFRTRPQDAGKTICIDSSYTPPGGTWVWASLCPPSPDVRPSWSGPKCYLISNQGCYGKRGNVDCDQLDLVDLIDLTVLVDYLFLSFAPLCLPQEANVDGDPLGSVDIVDLTRLVDYLFISFGPLADC